MTRTLPPGLVRLWPYVVAGVALAAALLAGITIARHYELADEQRRGQLELLEMRAELGSLIVHTAQSPEGIDPARRRFQLEGISAPVELAGDATIARELATAQGAAERAAARAGPEATRQLDSAYDSLLRAADRAGDVSEQTRREANASAAWSAAAGALLVAVLLWVIFAGRRRAAIEAAESRGLRRSELWFRELVQNSSDAILVTRPSGEIRYATPSL